VPVLLDTNVYLDALKSVAGATRFERQFLPLVFQTYLSSVVVEELYAGALDDGAVRLVARQVGALERRAAGHAALRRLEEGRQAGGPDHPP